MSGLKIFIGWDSREKIAYQVCRASLLKHTSVSLDITPIKQKDMRDRNLYWRGHDPMSSTEFTFHTEISWLNENACSNMDSMSVTDPTFQAEMFWLKT